MCSVPNRIYAESLLPKGYGYPLWLPEPNECLPEEYQESGTCIGDVGIVSSDGSFDYLFNVCHPASHPINVDRTPEDFEYVELRMSHDVYRNSGVHAPKSHVASASLKKRVLDAGVSMVENQ
jgi:hypothetical protein